MADITLKSLYNMTGNLQDFVQRYQIVKSREYPEITITLPSYEAKVAFKRTMFMSPDWANLFGFGNQLSDEFTMNGVKVKLEVKKDGR